MKHGLTRCHLRFATPEAYSPRLRRARKCVVERSIEEYSLHETVEAANCGEAVAGTVSEAAGPVSRGLQPQDIAGICANPLSEEPHPAVVRAVTRFGIVGLMACALGAGFTRWWRSLTR